MDCCCRACGNCEKAKRSVRGFFKPRWKSALRFFKTFPPCLRISISGVSFHKPSLSLVLAFCLFIAFFHEKFSVQEPQERR